MLMNIQVQCCGLFILCVLFIFHITRETVGFRSTKLYSRVILANFTCLILDILSIILISVHQGAPSFGTVLVARLYLVSLIVVFLFGYLYTCNDIHVLQRSRLSLALAIGFAAIGSLLAMLLPISIEYEEGRAYTYGPAVNATFFAAPAFILGTILLTIVFRRQMNPHRKAAIRIWMGLELTAGVIQFIFPELLLIGFVTSIGIMILFMELENPESEMDRTINVFSSHVMLDYIRQLYENNREFSGAFIINASEWKVSRAEEEAIMMEMAAFLKQIPRIKVFRGAGNDFALIIPSKFYSDDMIREIYERFILTWLGYEIHSTIIAIPTSRIAQSPEEVTMFYQYFRTKSLDSAERLIFFDEQEHARMQKAKLIQQEIISALDEDRVNVYYQPIYSIQKGRFVSAEALARINRADGSLMMPGELIPVAESTGLVEAIGARVLEKVCAMLRDHPITRLGIEYIEVNLSVAQCENRWLADDIEQLTKKYNIPPRLLNLEITETSAIRFRDIVISNMEKLTQSGFSFSLDDFGTGESNLNYIVHMPVHIVKFDRSMTQDYFKNERTKLVMDSVVSMIHNMNLKIVAEGIEEKYQVDAMAAIGVDYIQGYYYSKPIPLVDFLSFLHEHN